MAKIDPLRSAVLVTGGAGYIGSHAVLALCDEGRAVVVLDDLSTGDLAAIPTAVTFQRGDIADRELVGRLLRAHGVGLVMHFAGSVSPGNSLTSPLDYYRNNTAASLALAAACVEAGVDRFIFSSSAAVYGSIGASPFREDAPTAPLTPYGASKLMTEIILRDLSAARHGFNAVCLRYFNVAGADPAGRAGQRNRAAGSLIDRAIDVALQGSGILSVWGDDYDTRDGAGERDYIHVSDVAQVHLAAMRHLEAGGAGAVLNCGYGRGYTVLEVIAALQSILGREIPRRHEPRRPGDLASAVADVDRLGATLDWCPRIRRPRSHLADGPGLARVDRRLRPAHRSCRASLLLRARGDSR